MKMFIVLMALSTSAFGMSNEEAKVVHSLAVQPLGVVIDNTCQIRGAVWERGPLAKVDIGLIDIQTGQITMTKTNEKGVYAVSVPYEGKPRLFQERIASELIVSDGQKISIKDAGVVCDHRITSFKEAI